MPATYNLRTRQSVPYLFLKENAHWYSPTQINEHLKLVIEDIQAKIQIFSKLDELSYYVFLGKDEEDMTLVPRINMKNFSTNVPSVEMLRNKFLAEGVSVREKLALSRAIEESFDEHLEYAYYKINMYVYTMQRICEISSVTIETLDFLLLRIQEKITLFRTIIQLARSFGDLTVAFEAITRYKSQERFIQKELKRREELNTRNQ